ncbi:response regulator [Ponticoccus gilvus]|nr:response regulator [Enemella evansiae]
MTGRHAAPALPETDRPPAPTRHRRARLMRASRIAAGVAMAIALVTLVLGWLIRVDRVLRQAPDLPVMVPSTASAVALLALSLIVPADHHRAGLVRRLCAAAVLAICGWAVVSGAVTAAGDRMSPATALLLTLAALVSLIPPGRPGWTGLSTAGLVLALFALESWLLDLTATQSVGVLTGLSLPTAISLALIFAATLLRAPDRGWVALATAEGTGSRTARTVLPLAVLLPVLGAWLTIMATRQGLFPTTLGLTAGAALLGLVSAALVLRLARAQNREERAALEQGRRVAQLLDAIPMAVVVFDAKGEISTSNQAARDLAGAGRSVEVWLREARFLDPETRKPLAAAQRPVEALVLARRETGRLVGLFDDTARMRVLRFHCETLRPAGPDAGSLVLTVTDQTDSVTLQDRLSGVQRREALGQLAGGVAHELSNVLGVVRLASDTGLMQTEAAPMRQALETARDACARGSDLTRRMMAFGSDPSHEAPPDDALALIGGALRLIRPSLPPEYRLDASLPEESIGAIRRGIDLQTALLNLVLNARSALSQAARAEGRIAVLVRREGDTLVLTVRDDGPGMSAEALEQAQDPVFGSGQMQDGSGLGLSLTAAFAREMGGSLRLSSRPGHGTEAVLRLPMGPAAPAPEDSDTTPAPADGLSGRRALVVEDDPQFRAMLVEALRLMGLEVTPVGQPDAALDALDRGPRFDLLITDIRLGGAVDGHRLAALALDRQPGLPVLYLSGYAETQVPPERIVPGVMLRKPSSIDALRRAVSVTLRA